MTRHDDDHGATHGAHTIRASKGGGGKWLLGAVAAAVLLGGGYYAWSNYGSDAQSAYTDPYGSDDQYAADEQLRAGPLTSEPDTSAALTEDDSVATPAATPAPRRTTTPRATTQAQAVPEETFGITPVSATTTAPEENDEIYVIAPRRPIWTRTPSARRLSSLYPAMALDRGREGEARLHCTVQEGGALACERAEETNASFGNAALRVSRTLRHAEQFADGSDATGSPVNLRIVFRMDDEDGRG